MPQRHPCGACGSIELYEIPMIESDHSHIVVGDRLMRAISVCKFVCTDCGRVEEWVTGADQLRLLKSEIRSEVGGARDT